MSDLPPIETAASAANTIIPAAASTQLRVSSSMQTQVDPMPLQTQSQLPNVSEPAEPPQSAPATSERRRRFELVPPEGVPPLPATTRLTSMPPPPVNTIEQLQQQPPLTQSMATTTATVAGTPAAAAVVAVQSAPAAASQSQSVPATAVPSDEEEDDEHKVIGADPTGRFECYAKCLGMGAYKRVHLGFDQEEGVEVAWNELRLDHLQRKDVLKILSEVQILQQLRHESIINFFHSWMSKGPTGRDQVYFITELMTSGTLKAYIRKTKGAIKPKVLKNWCRQILRGLHYLHTRDPPIIHRDLKCENIFINGNNGQAKIGDLGLATFKSREHMSSVLGTPEFMAPELYDERYDEKVDIYAFGMCCLEMVTKEYPYNECTNQAQIFRKVTQNIKPASLEKINDPEVREFVELCIEHDPKRRPTAAELLQHPFLAMDPSASVGNMTALQTSAISPPAESQKGTTVAPTMVPTSTQASPETVGAGPSLTRDQQHSVRHALERATEVLTKINMDSRAELTKKISPTSPHRDQTLCSVEVLRVSGGVLTVKMICLRPNVVGSGDMRDPKNLQEVKFPFNLGEDTADSVVSEMIKEEVLRERDRRLAIENLRMAVRSVVNVLSVPSSPEREGYFRFPAAQQSLSPTIISPVDYTADGNLIRKRSRSNDVPTALNSVSTGPSSNSSNWRRRSRSLSVRPRRRSSSSDILRLGPPYSPNMVSRDLPLSAHPHLTEGRKLSFSYPNLSSNSILPRVDTNVRSAADAVKGMHYSVPASPVGFAPKDMPIRSNDEPSRMQMFSNAAEDDFKTQSNQPTSHYQKTLEQKTSEIIEGVYRSQYRRAASVSSNSSNSQNLGPLTSMDNKSGDGADAAPEITRRSTSIQSNQFGPSGPSARASADALIMSSGPSETNVPGPSMPGTMAPTSLSTSLPNKLEMAQASMVVPTDPLKATMTTMQPPAPLNLDDQFWQTEQSHSLPAADKQGAIPPSETDKAASQLSAAVAQAVGRSMSVDAERQLAHLQNLALSSFDAEVGKRRPLPLNSAPVPVATSSSVPVSATQQSTVSVASLNEYSWPTNRPLAQNLFPSNPANATHAPSASSVLLGGASSTSEGVRSRSGSTHSRTPSVTAASLSMTMNPDSQVRTVTTTESVTAPMKTSEAVKLVQSPPSLLAAVTIQAAAPQHQLHPFPHTPNDPNNSDHNDDGKK